MNQIKKSFKFNVGRFVIAGIILFAAQGAMANSYSNVAINGQVLTVGPIMNDMLDMRWITP